MRIAICDNEKKVLESIRALVESNERVNQIHEFLSLDEIWEAIEEGENFDLILMDIEWNLPKNGIDFAAELVQVSPNTQIIYVTGYGDKFAQQIFLKPGNICGYLVKPVQEDLLAQLIEKAWQTVQEWEEEKLTIQQRGVIHAVPIRKIYYLESRGHQVMIHTAREPILCYDRLESIKERLPAYFLQCHKSYLVNLDNVRRIEKNRMILTNKAEVPISKSRYSRAREAYFRYAGERL